VVNGKDRGRESRERARLYQARQEFQEGLGRRRRRDNLIAGIAGGLLILGIAAAQTVYFVSGPGAPEPAPTPSPSEMTPSPGVSSTPVPTTAPTAEPTPSPTP
jgi:hypothetical protein